MVRKVFFFFFVTHTASFYCCFLSLFFLQHPSRRVVSCLCRQHNTIQFNTVLVSRRDSTTDGCVVEQDTTTTAEETRDRYCSTQNLRLNEFLGNFPLERRRNFALGNNGKRRFVTNTHKHKNTHLGSFLSGLRVKSTLVRGAEVGDFHRGHLFRG